MIRWWLTPGMLLLAGLAHGQEPTAGNDNDRIRLALNGAHAFFRSGDYQSAEPIYRLVADQQNEAKPTTGEARFYQAECLRLQGRYPQAARVYVQALEESPAGNLRAHSIQRLYGVANYWLDDTREEIKQRQSGGSSLSLASVWIWDPSKPFLNRETEALHLLERVTCGDPAGPLAEKALFLMGSVYFFRQNYAEADRCFDQLVQEHPGSQLALLAMVRAVVARRRCLETGSSDWNKLAGLVRLAVAGLVDRRYVDEEDRQLLCRQLPWALWRGCRCLLPGCLQPIGIALVEKQFTEFAPGSKYRETFLTQESATVPLIEWTMRLPACVAGTCYPAHFTVRLLVEELAGNWVEAVPE